MRNQLIDLGSFIFKDSLSLEDNASLDENNKGVHWFRRGSHLMGQPSVVRRSLR